jgi:hypothetical protein
MERNYPVRNPDVVVRKEEKEALLFNPADGKMLCINGTGILVWDLSDGSRAVGDIVGKITDMYEVEGSTAAADSMKYLDDLEKAGFITYRA